MEPPACRVWLPRTRGRDAVPGVGIQQNMPYASGETPEMGDRISDKKGRVGAVTRITINLGKLSELSIRWNDGIVGILYPVAEDFTLISRAVKSDEQ